MEKVQAIEKPSSIEVSKNAKGQYSFKVKIYFEGFFGESETTAYALAVNQTINTIYGDLKQRFK
jgi:hypothetical protein